MKNFHKESSGMFGASSGRKLCRDRRLLRILGLSLVGSDPCAHTKGARCTRWAPGRKTGFNFWHRRRCDPEGCDGRRLRTWTHCSTEGTVESAHAVEFSKTVAPLRKGVPSRGRVRNRSRFRSGPVSIALARPRDEAPRRGRIAVAGRGCVAPVRPGGRPCVVGDFGEGL